MTDVNTAPLSDRSGVTAANDARGTLNFCMQLFFSARSARQNLVQQWYRNYQVLHNTFAGTPFANSKSVASPEVKPIVGGLVSWATDTEPIFDALPEASPYTPFYDVYEDMSDDLRMALQAGWKSSFVDAEVEKLLWDGFTYGIGFLKTTWDSSLHQGLGDFSIRRVDPYSFYVDPNATSMDDATFFVERREMPMQEVEKRWPGSRAKIEPGARTYLAGDEAPTRTNEGFGARKPMANPAAIAPSHDSRYGLPGQTNRDSMVEDAGVTIFEFWLRIPTTAKAFPTEESAGAKAGNADANPTKPDEDRIYDGWRCVVIAAGRTILVDEPASSFWSTNTHPYDRYVPEDTGEFYGDSLVQLLTPLQLIVNRNLSAILRNLDLTGDPVFLQSSHSNVPRTKIPNQPGQRLSIDGDVNNGVRWMEPPKLPPDYMNLVNWATSRMEVVSGLSAITRGAMPTGRNAQGVMDSVAEAGFVRLRNNLRNLERCLISSGNKAGAYICEFYDVPRVVALVGPGGERSTRALLGENFYVPTKSGRVPLNFQVHVDIGSQQATSKSARFSEAMTMVTTGLIDRQAALEMIAPPGYKDILSRMNQANQAQGVPDAAPIGTDARQQAGRMT